MTQQIDISRTRSSERLEASFWAANDMTRNLDEDEKGTQIVRTLGGVKTKFKGVL